jgi:hypothetical protein
MAIDTTTEAFQQAILGLIRDVNAQNTILFEILDQMKAAGSLDMGRLLNRIRENEAFFERESPWMGGSRIAKAFLDANRKPNEEVPRWVPVVVGGTGWISKQPSPPESADGLPQNQTGNPIDRPPSPDQS